MDPKKLPMLPELQIVPVVQEKSRRQVEREAFERSGFAFDVLQPKKVERPN